MDKKEETTKCNYAISESPNDEDKKKGIYRTYDKMNVKCLYIDIPSIFPLLQDIPNVDNNVLIKPSDFIKEMTLSTEERRQRLLKIHRSMKCADATSTSFKVLPDIIIFQSYVPGEIYTVPLTIVNITEVSKPLQVDFHKSYFFTMRHSRKEVCSKIAPGMPYQLFIDFSPDQRIDYQHKVTINSEKESFNIPIFAIGPRPLLDFPNEITLPSIPVKIEAEKILIIHNLGTIQAIFRMHVPAPFTIEPRNGVMKEGERIRLNIKYKPIKVGPVEETLTVLYESGEALGVKLKGYAEELTTIRLSQTFIAFEDTYMGLTRQETCEFRNTTKHVIRYSWMMYSSDAEDKARLETLRGNMDEMRRYHEKRYNALEYHNVCSSDGHRTICERMFQNEVDDMVLQQGSGDVVGLLYNAHQSGELFEIVPEFGEIWPNTTVTFTIIFKPTKSLSYSRNAYFDISGTETRTKVIMRGTGLGPAFELNMRMLDAQNIFLCASHRFEIVAHNKGIIPGTIAFANKKWDFGAEITFHTTEKVVMPGDIASFIFEFHSRIQGKFVEEIHFKVKESHEIIKMVIKGNVICPLLAFDIGEVNFGSISLGVPYIKKFNLVNNCQVPIEFLCSIQDDGHQHAVTCEEFIKMTVKELPEDPIEFHVNPIKGTVPGYSRVTVTIQLISNTVRHLSTFFILKMWGSNNYKATLCVEYDSNIPNIICKTPELHVNGCFINYPYNRSVILKNQSEFFGVILVDMQEAELGDGIKYTCPVTDFFIQPYGEVKVDITIITTDVGESRSTLAVQVFGSTRYSLSVVEIVCSGIGPTISFQPDVMDFEHISTLTTYSAPLMISNDSAIPANVEIVNYGKVCKIDRAQVVIEPNQTEEIFVSIYLKVACRFYEKLKIKVDDGDTVFYTIKAIAAGSSILCTPKLEPELNLGYLYTNKPFALEVIMKNESPVHHKILWSRLKYIKSFNMKELPVCNIPSIFTMTPVNFDFPSGSSIKVMIEGSCLKPNCVEEDFYCHAFIGKEKKTVTMSYILKANFVTPAVEKSLQIFHFRQDLGIETTVNFLEDAVMLLNNSKLPVIMELSVLKPFYIKTHEGLVNLFSLSLEDQEERSITIAYVPVYADKRCFKDNSVLNIQYVGLPTTDQIPILGEVNFPTIQLIPDAVDFGCLPVGTDSYVLVTMRNISPLKINYFSEFSNNDFKIVHIEVHEMKPETTKLTHSDIIDIVSYASNITKADEIATEITVNETIKCGYKEDEKWTECQKLFCSCKPNQFGNIKSVLQQFLPTNYDNPIGDSLQKLPKQPKQLSALRKIFDINPISGFLDPYECKMLTIAFNSIPNTQLSTTLKIRIQDGETEVLPIVGKCADLTYSLDECVEFGVQLFCEISERSLKLKNTSYEAVLYKVYHDQSDETPSANGWSQGFYSITPITGFLEPNNSIDLNVKYFPGCPGEFTKNVAIRIGHFKPVCVRLHGYAVFPQIYIGEYFNFATTRNEEDPTIGYNAIATLSLDYILLMRDLRMAQLEMSNLNKTSEAFNSLFIDEWEVVVYHYLYPTKKDIELAIERYLANAVTSTNPPALKDHVIKNRAMFVPRFAVQAYHIDFGLVVINSEAQLSVPVECYCHYSVDFRLVSVQNMSNMAEHGLTLVFKKMNLQPGEVKTFHIIFKPTALIFTKPDVEMSFVISFSIVHGPIIPMKISAFVTTPRAHTSTTLIDFGDVQCGMAVRQSMIIENSGRILCKWKAKLVKQVNKSDRNFLLRDSTGVLQSGESTLIYITFQPEYDGLVRSNLKIFIDDNPDIIDIKLKGSGLQSKLIIEDDFVQFNTVLPYSYHERYISIKNKGSVPIEFVFTDFDNEYEEEKIILRLLMKYYNTDVLYIPPRTPGSPLPEPLINFYKSLQADTLDWLKQTKDRLNKESSEIIQNNQKEPYNSKSSVINKNKTAQIDSSMKLFTLYENEEEIIADYIKHMRDSKSDKLNRHKVDPIAQTIAEAKDPVPEIDPTDIREGVLLIFTGAPLTNAVEVANRASIILKLPVVNVNDLIYEALLRNETLAAIKINHILDETYESLALTSNKIEDAYDALIDKVDLILDEKSKKKPPISAEKVTTKSASSKSKSSKSSKGKGDKETSKVSKVAKSKASTKSPKSARKVKNNTEITKTLLNIPIELLVEAMQSSLLTYEDGVIIESVITHFISDPTLVLKSILKAIGNIRHIQIITLLYTWDKYLKFKNEQRDKQRQKEEEELTQKIFYFETMDAEQFEQMTPADKALFKKHVLSKRKEATKYRVAVSRKSRASRIMLRNQRLKKLADRKSVDTGKKSITSGKLISNSKTDKLSSKNNKSSKKSNKSKGSKTLTNESKSKKSKKDKAAKVDSHKDENRVLAEEEKLIKIQFHKFEEFYFELIHVAEFWNRKICDVIKPYDVTSKKRSSGKKLAKSKSSKGSAKTSAKKTIPPKNLDEKVNQVVTPKVDEGEVESAEKIQIGIPCSIFDDARLSSMCLLENYLTHARDLISARQQIINSRMDKSLVESTEFFSILYQLEDHAEKSISAVFKISEAKSLQDFCDENLTTSNIAKQNVPKPKKKPSVCAEKRFKTTVETSSIAEKLTDIVSLQNPSAFFDTSIAPRAVIRPNETLRYKIIYHPTSIGENKHVFSIETVIWPKKYELICFGTADIPRILNDPNMLFSRKIARRTLYTIKSRVFIQDLDVFDFGDMLIRQANNNPKLLMKEADFTLINQSLLPCITKIYLQNTENDVFSLDQAEIIITPNNSVQLKVYANPHQEQCFENKIYICVKDNPEVYIINLKCTGCLPQFTVNPSVLSFDRVLYQTIEKRTVKLQNDSPVPLRWSFTNMHAALVFYNFAPKSGIINGFGYQLVEFQFIGVTRGEFAPIKLDIEIFDEESKLKNPLMIQHLELTAEVIDVTIEYESHIHFGDIKGKVETIIDYQMVNYAKYDVEYVFFPITVPDYPESRIQKKATNMTKVHPQRGILKSNKPFVAHIHIMANTSMDLQYVPVMSCIFMETYFNQQISQFNLFLSGRIHLSKFELCPQSEILFGRQLVESESIENISIKNIGKFSFTYNILSLVTLLKKKKKLSYTSVKGFHKKKKNKKKDKKRSRGDKNKSKSTKSTKESKKTKSTKSKTKSTKSKSKKKSNSGKSGTAKSKSSANSKSNVPSKLEVGEFTVVPSTGIVQPGETVSIKIVSKPKDILPNEETILFFVSEPHFADRLGRSVVLKSQGQIPHLNLDNLDEIFKEHYVVEKMTNLICPEQMACNMVFVKDEKTLFFNKVCLNTEKVTRIKITNDSMIHTEVFCKIISGSGPFTVNPNVLVIEGYNYSNFSITFKPTAIEIFSAMLEVSYNSMSSFKAKSLVVKLIGDGYIPEIALYCPLLANSLNIYELHYDSVMVGETMKKSFEVDNVSAIACQVLCSISEDINDEFLIIPPTMVEAFKFSDKELPTYKDHLFKMEAGERSTIEIEYKPITEPGIKSILKIHILNNPYEIFTIVLHGESFNQDIKLENLSTFTYQPVMSSELVSKSRKASQSPPSTPVTYAKPCYELNFGYIQVNRLEKQYFKITNTSEVHTYKFELGNINNLLFIPAVGHLRPKATKEIIATFLIKEPVSFQKEILSCRFYRICYLQTVIDPLSWDERQMFVVWTPVVGYSPSVCNTHTDTETVQFETLTTEEENTDELSSVNVKMKTLEGKLEPLYEEVVDSSRNLNIFFSVISDYNRVHCSITELSFDDTLLFEKRNLKFTIQNKSNIPLVMDWQVIMDEYPKRISYGSKNKFGIDETKRPQTGISMQRTTLIRPAPLRGDEKFITNCHCSPLPRPSSARSSLFNSSSGGSSRTRDSWCDTDVLPFTIHPQNFAIPPKENEIFTVTFAPTDVYKFTVRLASSLNNLAPDENNVDISIVGRSLLPLYYFNIEPTDYLVRRKGGGKRICDDLVDENTRILEFNTIGIGYITTKTITVINPTGETFAYRWISHQAPQLSHFRCHTINGLVTKGKMIKAEFSFMAQEVGVFEEYFTFHIDRYDLRAIFLLVGTTREPCVFFNTPSVLMKPTVIGIDVCQYVVLKNSETIELGFKFLSKSFWCEKRVQRLIVEPKIGVLKPKSETKIKFTYHPLTVGETNFFIKCEIEKCSAPCILCIITNSFAVEPKVEYVDCMGTRVALDPLKMTTMDLNDLPPIHEYKVPVFVENIGQTGFYFNWTAKNKYCADSMKISFNDKEGYVKRTTIVETSFSISALKYFKKRRAHVTLEILHGPSFPITVIGSTCKITYKFSFEEYNFGPCLVQLDKSTVYKINLQFTNLENQPITLDYSADPLNHLTVCFKAAEVNSKATETINIYFHPMQVMDYENDLIFYVNSKAHKIRIRGSSVPINLELVDCRDKYIDLGSPYKGSVVQRTIKVLNNGLCTVSIAVNLYDRLPIFHRPEKDLSALYEFLELSTSEISVKAKTEKQERKMNKKKGKKNKSNSSKGSKRTKKLKDSKKTKSSRKSKESKKSIRSNKKTKDSAKKSKGSKGSKKKSKKKNKRVKTKIDSKEIVPHSPEETQEEKEKRQMRESVQIKPKAFITIPPKKTTEFVLKFTPSERIAGFTEKIFYQIQDQVDVLCMFKGSSLGSDYYLERDYITFTNIIRGCKAEEKLTLFNTGDIGGRFQWRFYKSDEAVTIHPMEGYISTNTIVVFTISFKPEVIQCTTRARLKCTIEHFDKTLNLLVNGSSSDYPAASDTILFTCPVRLSNSQVITVQNTSCAHWYLDPMVTSPLFEVPYKVSMDPQSCSKFDVTYNPTSMTKDSKDTATLILHTPHGQAILYQLEGHALRPEAIPIQITIPCKQEYVHVLPVKNWLRVPQLFKVFNEVIPSNTNKLKTLYKLTGNEYIQVHALGERNYNWTIYVINEGNLHFKTKIRHEASGEYIIYEIYVTVTKCSALDEIHLSSCVRHVKACKLKFENSIGTPVDFHFQTNASNLEFPGFVTLRPYSEYFLKILYTPLITSDSKTYVFEATTKELGVYPYTFHLSASPAIPEKLITIEAPLGFERSQKILLENMSFSKADFAAKFEDSSMFYLSSNISIGPKEKTHFEINFEPSTLGTVESKLSLTSLVAGEFIYPLKGIGVLPKPQGPFLGKPGGTINIQIRNPFVEQKTFAFETNSINFEVKPRSESIKSKQTYKIVVKVAVQKSTKQDTYINAYPLTGKLTVSCNDALYSNLKWVYYLQAE